MYATTRHTKSTPSPRSFHDHSSSPRGCATFVLNDVLSSTRLKPFCSSPIVFTPSESLQMLQMAATGHGPVLEPGLLQFSSGSLGDCVRGAAGSCHHGIRHPWPLARRHDSICGSAASRGQIRHRRPWPRIDQVALGIIRRWQERGTWLARVRASSIASRYSLWIRGVPLLGNGSVALTCNLSKRSYRQLKMELQSVCWFAL